MWRCRDRRSSFHSGICIGSTDVWHGFAELFYFLVQVRIGDSDLGGEGVIPAEFQKLRNVDSACCVKQEADDLDNVAGVMLDERATRVTKFLRGRTPLGAGVEKQFDTLECFGFVFRLSVGAPR